MNKKERLEAMISYYGEGKPSAFAKLLGVAPSTISSWMVRDTIDYDLVFAKCEGISAEWLLSGEGQMLKNAANEQKASVQSEDVQVDAILQIKLRKDKKNQVLNLLFGENNIEILNK